MIEKIFTTLTKTIKNNFPNCNIWKSPVDCSYKDNDFVVSLKSYTKSPKTSGYSMNSVCFLIKRNSLDFSYDDTMNLEKAVDIITLDNDIMLKALVTKNQISGKEFVMELIYSFNTYESKNTHLMEKLKGV